MRPLSWKWLADSGLPFDWMTLFIGWKGFGERKLSGEEIVDAAQERVGLGTSQQDKLTALLMHADPRDFWTIRDYLEQLAQTETISETLALRKWRVAELSSLLILLEKIYHQRLVSNPKWNFDDDLEMNESLLDFWISYDELPDNREITIDWFSRFLDTRQQCREWLSAEEAALRGILEIPIK